MDKGLDRHLHVQELGLQGLYKQLLGHGLRQGICNHLGSKTTRLPYSHPLTFIPKKSWCPHTAPDMSEGPC